MGSRTVPFDPEAVCAACGKKGALDFMGDCFCPECAADVTKPLDVVCARCGKAGTSKIFMLEEGDEWECEDCWARCEAQERADLQTGENDGR